MVHSFWMFLADAAAARLLHQWRLRIVHDLAAGNVPDLAPGASGSGFAFSFGRIFGALGPTMIGLIAGLLHSYPIAITLVSMIYLVGVPFIFMAP